MEYLEDTCVTTPVIICKSFAVVRTIGGQVILEISGEYIIICMALHNLGFYLLLLLLGDVHDLSKNYLKTVNK